MKIIGLHIVYCVVGENGSTDIESTTVSVQDMRQLWYRTGTQFVISDVVFGYERVTRKMQDLWRQTRPIR